MVRPVVAKTTNTPPFPVLEGDSEPPSAEPRRPWHVRLAVTLLGSVGVLTGVLSLLSGVMVIVGIFELRDALHRGNGRADQVGALWVALPCVAALVLAALTYGISVWSNRIWRVPREEPNNEED